MRVGTRVPPSIEDNLRESALSFYHVRLKLTSSDLVARAILLPLFSVSIFINKVQVRALYFVYNAFCKDQKQSTASGQSVR